MYTVPVLLKSTGTLDFLPDRSVHRLEPWTPWRIEWIWERADPDAYDGDWEVTEYNGVRDHQFTFRHVALRQPVVTISIGSDDTIRYESMSPMSFFIDGRKRSVSFLMVEQS